MKKEPNILLICAGVLGLAFIIIPILMVLTSMPKSEADHQLMNYLVPTTVMLAIIGGGLLVAKAMRNTWNDILGHARRDAARTRKDEQG